MIRKDTLFTILTIIFFVFISIPGLAAERGISLANKEKRFSLVIGNGDYKNGPLENPVNDAKDMAATMKECGFKVLMEINCNRTEMRDAVREFGDMIKQGGVGLFFYAGHGLQVDGENYLVPLEADIENEYEIEDECLKVSSVLRSMEAADNRLNIIILDACRNNPFKSSFRSANRGLVKMDAPTGSILAYSTAPGSVAKDGKGRNGLYTSNLLKYMHVPGLSLEEMFKRVRIDVMVGSEDQQVPWESSSLTGNFSFVPGDSPSQTDLIQLASVAPVKYSTPSRERYYLHKKEYIKVEDRFVQEDNNTIYDKMLDKRWMLVEGDKLFSWDEAKGYTRKLVGDFRLPTKDEMASLLIKSKAEGDWGFIDSDFFPENSRTKCYWTGSKAFLGAGYWYMDYKDGELDKTSGSNYFAIICISD